jgi:hypothetical protein
MRKLFTALVAAATVIAGSLVSAVSTYETEIHSG